MASQTESLPDALLEALAEKGRVDSYEYATSVGRNHQDVVGAVKSLESFGDILKTEQKQTELWELTEEGKEIAENGSHEVRLFEAVNQSNGTPQNELMPSKCELKRNGCFTKRSGYGTGTGFHFQGLIEPA